MRFTLLLLAASSLPALAFEPPQPRLVKDINSRIEDLGSFPREFVRIGNTVFFQAHDPVHGHELWKTDGTEVGTVLLKDLVPGSTGGQPYNLTAVGDVLFFTALNGVGGTVLWKSDGSTEGTVSVSELLSGGFTATLKNFVGVGDKIFFVRDQGRFPSPSLYSSDGTEEGTIPLNPIDWESGNFNSRPFHYPQPGLPSPDGSLVFPANNNELWISDGSTAGTEMLAELPMGNGDGMQLLDWVGDILFMTVPDEEGNAEIWKYSWNTSQVDKVYGLDRGGVIRSIVEAVHVDGSLVFTAIDEKGGHELWTSNGRTAGTRRVKDIRSGSGGSDPRGLTAVGSAVYFLADDIFGQTQVWVSNGTAKSTRKIFPAGKKEVGEPRLLTPVGNALYFVTDDAAGTLLWRRSGKAKAPVMLKKIAEKKDVFALNQLVQLGKNLLFTGNDGKFGNELWVSDGTSRGTKLLKDIREGTEDGYTPWEEIPMAALGDHVLFRANDGIRGEELWTTNGTPDGTRLVSDIVPGEEASEPRQMTEAGGSVYFVVQDPKARDVLWKTDGSPTGTSEVIDLRADELSSYIDDLTSFGGRLWFTANQGETAELWSTDGTPEDTYPIKPAGIPLEWPSFLTVLGDKLYLSANRNGTGEELWCIDGTAAGSAMVKDLRPGPLGSSPSFLAKAGNRIFFRAFTDFAGIQLWVTDGSAEGTMQADAEGALIADADIYPMIPAEGNLYFLADDGVHGNELWRSDGKPAGTAMVKDIHPEGEQRWEFGSEHHFAVVGDILYFLADDGVHGEELWRSDGTSNGTFMVADIFPGEGHSRPADMIVVGDRIYFSADDGSHGREWWTSDGATVGTLMVADLSPGSGGSNPRLPFLHGKKLYICATTPQTGSELWVMDGVE